MYSCIQKFFVFLLHLYFLAGCLITDIKFLLLTWLQSNKMALVKCWGWTKLSVLKTWPDPDIVIKNLYFIICILTDYTCLEFLLKNTKDCQLKNSPDSIIPGSWRSILALHAPINSQTIAINLHLTSIDREKLCQEHILKICKSTINVNGLQRLHH